MKEFKDARLNFWQKLYLFLINCWSFSLAASFFGFFVLYRNETISTNTAWCIWVVLFFPTFFSLLNYLVFKKTLSYGIDYPTIKSDKNGRVVACHRGRHYLLPGDQCFIRYIGFLYDNNSINCKETILVKLSGEKFVRIFLSFKLSYDIDYNNVDLQELYDVVCKDYRYLDYYCRALFKEDFLRVKSRLQDVVDDFCSENWLPGPDSVMTMNNMANKTREALEKVVETFILTDFVMTKPALRFVGERSYKLEVKSAEVFI